MNLISKIQYKSFETGEFAEEKQRSYEETLQLIEAFPWESEREHFSVSLTGPSITLQDPDGHFLKLALYYNGKFVCYYLDAHQHLYTQSFSQYQDAYPTIQAFFNAPHSVPAGSKRTSTPLQHNIAHFKDGNFNYRINYVRLLPYLLFVAYLVFAGVLATFAIPRVGTSSLAILIPIALAGLILFWIIANIILFLNHWLHTRKKVLIISKGKDAFSYGPAEGPATFNKKDILDITTIGLNQKGDYPATTIVEINFVNGQSIDISCLLIRYNVLLSKFPGCKTQKVYRMLPFMPSDAVAPA